LITFDPTIIGTVSDTSGTINLLTASFDGGTTTTDV